MKRLVSFSMLFVLVSTLDATHAYAQAAQLPGTININGKTYGPQTTVPPSPVAPRPQAHKTSAETPTPPAAIPPPAVPADDRYRRAYEQTVANTLGVPDPRLVNDLMIRYPYAFSETGVRADPRHAAALNRELALMRQPPVVYAPYAGSHYDRRFAYTAPVAAYALPIWMHGCGTGAPTAYLKFKYMGAGKEKHLWFVSINGATVGTIDQADSWYNDGLPICADGTSVVEVEKLGFGKWTRTYSTRPFALTEIPVGDFLPLKRD